MPQVNNWQIGRNMQYVHEDARPERQIGFVFDINRCIGCQTCTMACRSTWTFSKGQEYMWWNNVETKPYGGYPQNWDVKLLSMLGPQAWDEAEYKGQTVFEDEQGRLRDSPLGYLPTQEEWRFPNIYEDTATGYSSEGVSLPEHRNFFFYLQRICNHCTYPACLAACPRNAIHKREEDGIVLLDQHRCRGYRHCMAACPYKKTMYNSSSRITEKCIACFPRVEDETCTRCTAACVGSIRLQGWINPPEQADPENPIDYLVHTRKVALPLYPQFGTEPNVYYIPPRWVPKKFLSQMFGPGVEQAVASRSQPDAQLLAVMKLFGTTTEIITRFEANEDHVLGRNEQGEVVVKVPIQEPFYERPFRDVEADAYRFNEA